MEVDTNLVIDIGNTRCKYAFFRLGRLVEASYQRETLFEDIEKWKKQGGKLCIFLSGSGRVDSEFRALLRDQADCFWEAVPGMDLPIKINYATPETLGFDRIAVCVGGRVFCPNAPLLVIDSGTCVTYNYVSGEGCFLGGNISPGLGMRFKSLNQYTASLPEISPEANYGGMGCTTEEAIRNGVMEGMLFEIRQYMREFVRKNSGSRVLLTGGNACFLEGRLGADAMFNPYLGFWGLNEILKYVKK